MLDYTFEMVRGVFLMAECCKKYNFLTDWEKGFIDCLRCMDISEDISKKQYEQLKKIYQVLIFEEGNNKC